MTPPDRARRLAHQVASMLLSYPDEQLLERLPDIREAVGDLPEPVAAPLWPVVEHLAATPLQRLAADYVETFDLRRRCCLYLTYYTHGDTCRRA